MNKNNINVVPDNFDALMLQLITNNFDNTKEIQKSVDMNANYVFTMPIEHSIESYTEKKIAEIISMSKKFRFIIIKITSLLGVIGLITLIIYNAINNNTSGNESGTPAPHIVPVIKNNEENVETDSLIIENTTTEISALPHITSITAATVSDTAETAQVEIKTEEVKNPIPAVYSYNEPVTQNKPMIKSGFSFSWMIFTHFLADVTISSACRSLHHSGANQFSKPGDVKPNTAILTPFFSNTS